MTNSADPDQLASSVHCLHRQGISGSSRTRVNDAYVCNIFLVSLLKQICCRYSLELPQNAKAILLSIHNICIHEELDKC